MGLFKEFPCVMLEDQAFSGPEAPGMTGTGNGAFYAGATVTVTYAGGATATGVLVVDPNDPNGAQVDL